jgi:hypothetical protein
MSELAVRPWGPRIGPMSAGASVEEAARNNAEWCDSFCRTHGIKGRFDPDAWTSATRTPPLYPDAVTLVAGASAEAVLLRVDSSVGCAIKDSFADLNLAPLSFDRLFAAAWLCQEPPRGEAAPHDWSMITRQDELQRWESSSGISTEPRPFFRRELLTDQHVAVLARYEGNAVVSGATANRSRTVFGLGNVFDLRRDLESAWRDAASAARALWGAMPAVSYDVGESLAAAQRAGFSPRGRLVVWVKREESGRPTLAGA